MNISISITDKRATVLGAPVIVCGNSGYTVTFAFDDEWPAGAKTARFVFVENGAVQHIDRVFDGNTVDVPVLFNIREVQVGVFAGDLQTTTPGRIPCEKSIRCGSGETTEFTQDQYDQIMALLNENKAAFPDNPPVSRVPSMPIGEVVSTFQDGHGWKAVTLGTYTATIAADTNDFLLGSQSVRFVNCIQKDNLNLNMEGKHIRVRFKVNSIDPGASLQLYVADTASFGSFMAFDIYSTAQFETHRVAKLGEWADIIIPWCGNESTNMPEMATVGTLRFKFVNGAGDANVQLVALQDIPAVESKGVVSFTFDDGLVTQHTAAAKILGARGISATAYIIPTLVGTNDNCMTEEQIVSLKTDYGWDIESHGASRLDEMTDDEIIADFAYTKKWIQDRGLGRGDHYAYPNGVFDDRIKGIARKYFATARTIDYLTFNGFGSTLLPEPYNIRAVSAIGNNPGGHAIANVKLEIDRVAQYGGWLVLVFHSIGDTATAMYCAPDDLAEIADYAIAAGVDIKTVADVLR